MHKIRYILPTIAILLAFTACDRSEVYSHYVEMRKGEWTKKDKLIFEIDASLIELGAQYDISLDINNNDSYSYSDLWLFVEHNLQSDTALVYTQREYRMVDDKGRWLGSGGYIYRLPVSLFDNYTFSEKRNFRFEIRHGMRDEPLVGIEKIGLRITKKGI